VPTTWTSQLTPLTPVIIRLS
jgi:hypothetical protein